MSSVDHELDCAERGVLVVERSLDTIRVTGPDRLTWLNGMLTQNLAKAAPGDAFLGLAVAKNGKIETEVALLAGSDDVLLGVAKDTGAELLGRLDRHLIMEDAALALEPGIVWSFAFGPLAREALGASSSAGGRGGVTRRAGVDVAILAATSRVADAVLASVKPAAIATAEGWEAFRVKRGIAERGVDYTTENYPQEAGLERDEVSFEKGCYLGQEAVFMLEKRGHVQKRLVQLECSAHVERGAPISDPDGKAIGEITTAIAAGAGSLALGYVKYKHARAGRELTVGGSPAKVTETLAITPE